MFAYPTNENTAATFKQHNSFVPNLAIGKQGLSAFTPLTLDKDSSRDAKKRAELFCLLRGNQTFAVDDCRRSAA